MCWPMASSGSKPKSVVAAGFQPETRSSLSIVTIATGLTSTSDSKYDFWRSELGRPVLDPPLEGRDVRAELGGHLVEGGRERADLVLAIDPGDCLQVARGHLGRPSPRAAGSAG